MLSWARWASACPRGGRILGCVTAPCALLPALLDSRSQSGRHLSTSRRRPSELLLEPAAPSTQSLFLCPRRRHLAAPRDPQPPPHRAATRAPQSCSCFNTCALQPVGSSVHSPGSAGVCLCPMEPKGIPALLGSCSESLQAPFPPGRMVQLLLLWDRALLTGGHSPWP